MPKATLSNEEKLEIGKRVFDGLTNGGKLVIIIHSVSNTGNYRYSVSLIAPKKWPGGSLHLSDYYLNYWFAACTGDNLDAAHRIKSGEVGTNRYFLAAYNVGLILKGLGLTDDPYSVSEKRLEF